METILQRYHRLHPTSARLYQQASGLFPSGVTHDTRHYAPFTIYVDRAQGSSKWDVDGNEYVDYVMGHGSLLLGHARPEVVAAVQAQVAKGSHYGAGHRLELEWAALVRQLIPSAERVRYTSSGTEATMMALRLARAFTQKSKIIKFQEHFHGWHDYVVASAVSSAGALAPSGIPPAVVGTMVVLPPNDPAAVQQVLEEDRDVAGIILEPTGASMGVVPVYPSFLGALRELATRYGVVLIFDEVVTGFRTSTGGAQQRYGVIPDLTALAKILAGGLPGGAVAGRAEILHMIEFGDERWNATRRVPHPGTFNANPVSAAAGVAALTLVATGKENAQADAMAQRLRSGLNDMLERLGVPGCANGVASMCHLRLGRECGTRTGAGCDRTICQLPPADIRAGIAPQALSALKQGMLNHGVDLMGRGAIVSSAHTPGDIDHTVSAFEATVGEMLAEELLSRRGGGK
ncbi:MAG: aspartate aminotransferase family protein [Chloroflexi bacterium]|nr:aspartate aminotransferase family protein [Chloroflexota bacterium]